MDCCFILQVPALNELQEVEGEEGPQQELLPSEDAFETISADSQEGDDELLQPVMDISDQPVRQQSLLRGGRNQHHYPPYPPVVYPPPYGRRFYIRHKSTGLYLDNAWGRCSNGNNIQLWSFNGGGNQQWYEGPNNTIMSCSCPNMVVDIEQGCFAGHNIHLYSYHGRENQQFVFSNAGTCTIDNYNCGVSLYGSMTSSWGASGQVISWHRMTPTLANQQWERIYV